MESINRIGNGIDLDNDKYYQPEGTLRDSQNGITYDPATGKYSWHGLKGTTALTFLGADVDNIIAACNIRNRYFVIVLNTSLDYVKLIELTMSSTGIISSSKTLWQSTNTKMKFNVNYPIRSIFGIYENDNLQCIYLTDFNNQPRIIRLNGTNVVTLNEKFIDFFPVIDGSYGKMYLVNELSGGTLPAGTHYFAFRLFKDGYYTDWSPLSAPVSIVDGVPGTNQSDYHNVEGKKPDYITNKGLQFKIDNIDDDYSIIQVVSFYSNDLNSVKTGTIIYESFITSSSLTINYYGGENNGSVSIADVTETSVVINKCREMVQASKYNILANIVERDELNVSLLNSLSANDRIDAEITPKQYCILLDTAIYPATLADGTARGLYGLTSNWSFKPGVWQIATSEVAYTDLLHPMGVVVAQGKYFLPDLGGQLTSGTCQPAIVIKKYRKASASYPYDVNDDYSLDAQSIEGEYYNYKNPRFTEKLKGYPAGETIRLGILFFDKTGRPFFVRWINNTLTTTLGCTIGPGDTRIPERYQKRTDYPSLTAFHLADCLEIDPSGYYYKTVIGQVNYLSISNIDITSIKDQIGGFSIVRCPIEHENIGYGALGFMFYDSGSVNDIRPNPGFCAYDSDQYKYKGAYTFYCPEDMFELSGFSIQPGDKIENKFYLTPFTFSSTYDVFTGMGVLTVPSESNKYDLYQKFYIFDNNDGSNNGARTVQHDVIAYTKYRQGDGDDISIDPRDATKLLRYQTDFSGRKTHLTNLGIVVLDIDETGDNSKGIFNCSSADPTMLVCSVKRPITNKYNGTGVNGLASSIYISTGHFQPITDAVLADIYDDITEKYIFNEVEIFGGDVFVCIWDFMRNMINEDLNSGDIRYSHSIMMPIESRINLDLREGSHIGKNKTYHSTANPTDCIRWKVGSDQWEDHNYNDGYSTDNPSRYYLPVPINFQLQSKYDTTFRFSNPKSNGEYVDSFRVFKPLNKYVLPTRDGEIVNARYKRDKLIIWQERAISYLPVGERALVSDDNGSVIQLGVSGIFERDDQIIDFVGNSNQFGLAESPAGFHWYDSIKKMFISLTENMQLTPESIAKGLDSFFTNDLPNDLFKYDNPRNSYGINGYYSPLTKMVYTTIFSSTKNITIIFNPFTGKFEGFTACNPRLTFIANNFLYGYNPTLENDLQKMESGPLGQYFGALYTRSFTVIVKGQENISKIFDNWELIGNDKFFDYIKFTLEDGSTITEYYTQSDGHHISQKVKYFNRKWNGSFPKLSTRERLSGSYLEITFYTISSNDVKFTELKTFFRQLI